MPIRYYARHEKRPPARLVLVNADVHMEFIGGIQSAEAQGETLCFAMVRPSHRDPATLAKLVGALLVDHAEQILRPSLMPERSASAALLPDGTWRSAGGRTLPGWATREIERVSTLLLEEHRGFLEGGAKALEGILGHGFRKPGLDFPIRDDTGLMVVAERIPEIDVDISQSDSVWFGDPKWYELVRLEYRRDRFMQRLTDEELGRRVSDITANLTVVTEDGLVGLLQTQDPALMYWFIRFTETMEEIALRYGPYPAGFREGRIRAQGLPESLNPQKLGTPRNVVGECKYKGDGIVKYGREQYLRPALDRGALRMSAASAYLDPSLNTAIQDDELTAELDLAFPSPPQIVIPGERRSYIRITGSQRLETNYYVFCTSRALELRLFTDFAADCCLVIHNLTAFSERLCAAVDDALPGWRHIQSDLQYYDPLQVMPAQIQLPLSKHFRYAYQKEYRFAWLPPQRRKQLAALHIELGSLKEIAEIDTLAGPHSW